MRNDSAVLDPMLELRNGTQDLHSRIETSTHFSVLMQEQVTLGDYLQALELLSRFYADKESQLIAGITHYFSAFNYIPRQPLLNQDLRKLGIAKDDKPGEFTTAVPSKSEILGLLYVVEGSALGGQIITRHLAQKLGKQISEAMRFYTLDGKMPPDHWTKVKCLFRESLNDREEIAQTVFSAREAFNCLLI